MLVTSYCLEGNTNPQKYNTPSNVKMSGLGVSSAYFPLLHKGVGGERVQRPANTSSPEAKETDKKSKPLPPQKAKNPSLAQSVDISVQEMIVEFFN